MENKDGLTGYNRRVCHATEKCKRTLKEVAKVCKQIMATLYDTNFPGAEALRPGPKSLCPDSDILTISWLLELIGKDCGNAGYKMIKAELSDIIPYLPERSRFNRRWRSLCKASENLEAF